MSRGRRLPLLAAAALALLVFLLSLLPSLFRGGGAPPTGRVVTASGGPAPPGTVVVARGAPGDPRVGVDSEGAFRFDPRPDGVREFEARCGPLSCSAPAGPGPVTLRLPPIFAAAGRVVGPEGEALAGAAVACGGRTARTDERGRFRIEGIPAPEGRPPAITVRPGGSPGISVEPPPDAAWDDLFLRVDAR